MRIEIAYAAGSLEEKQIVFTLDIPEKATVKEAIYLAASINTDAFSRLLRLAGLTSIDALLALPLGRFGQRVEPTYALQDGDRIEIYRPLKIDPKKARRQRAITEPKI